MSVHPVLINGSWRPAKSSSAFQAANPATGATLTDEYPMSTWEDVDEALDAAVTAFHELQNLPKEIMADFLEKYADRIEAKTDELVTAANEETGLPVSPRLKDGELPRTTGQLRQAAAATRDRSWSNAVLDTANNIRACYSAIGPVAVFGPNNFPFAFGSISGGDFAAAIAAGNPVIAKAHSSHPTTTRIFAEEAKAAADEVGLPAGTIQMIYRLDHADGAKLVADKRLGATGYTGGRHAGFTLKNAADQAGNPIYLELSSVNPVVILPGALEERLDAIVDEFTGSCLMGTGQFCTNPGLVVLLAGENTESFISKVSEKFSAAPVGTLLSAGTQKSLAASISSLTDHGAQLIVGGTEADREGFCYSNTLLRISGQQFMDDPETAQTEAFGNASVMVVADSVEQIRDICTSLEGNLTGCVYTDNEGSDDQAYDLIAPRLRQRVGRLLNDKMPTGVAVSPAMNHGGPFPATGHPSFTAVGIPAAMIRFAALHCYDGVRGKRLPAELADANPNGTMWRNIDGSWTQSNLD